MNQNSRSKKMYRTLATLAVAAMLASVPVAAEATPIYLDITSQYVGSADNGTTFTGVAQQWTLVGGTDSGNINGGYFSVTSTGLFIGADTDHDNTIETTLLTGDIIALLSSDNTDRSIASYTFSFRTTGGDLESLIPHNSLGTIEIAGIDLDETDTAFYGGTADTKAPAPVPEPATMSLLLVGGGAMAALRRRRRPTPTK